VAAAAAAAAAAATAAASSHALGVVETGGEDGSDDGDTIGEAVDEPDYMIEAIDSAGFDPTVVGSRWRVNFTVELDCASILPYGIQSFPAENTAGRRRNFRSLPFPLPDSRCQPLTPIGVQTTRDRPFTIAELIMQQTVEEQLTQCITPTEYEPCHSTLRFGFVTAEALAPIGGFLGDYDDDNNRRIEGGNCTVVCPPFLECVHNALLSNRTSYEKQRCLTTTNGLMCAARTIGVYYNDNYERIPRRGFYGICFDYGCLECVVRLFELYFTCAVTCTRDATDVDCIDCAYTFENSHMMLLKLRDRMWEAYFLNMLGEYAVEDMLTANFTSCAISGQQCLSMQNYNMHALGIGDEPSFLTTGVHPVEEDT